MTVVWMWNVKYIAQIFTILFLSHSLETHNQTNIFALVRPDGQYMHLKYKNCEELLVICTDNASSSTKIDTQGYMCGIPHLH